MLWKVDNTYVYLYVVYSFFSGCFRQIPNRRFIYTYIHTGWPGVGYRIGYECERNKLMRSIYCCYTHTYIVLFFNPLLNTLFMYIHRYVHVKLRAWKIDGGCYLTLIKQNFFSFKEITSVTYIRVNISDLKKNVMKNNYSNINNITTQRKMEIRRIWTITINQELHITEKDEYLRAQDLFPNCEILSFVI